MMKPQMDANVYATRKTVVQGLMDVALLSSNASQLKYLLKKGPEHEFYVALLLMVIASITLQVNQH